MRNRAPVQVLRSLAKWVFWPASILLVLNVEKLGEEFGWDKLLVRHWSPVVSSALDVLLSSWVQYPAVFLLGVALGVWLDARLWSRELRAPRSDRGQHAPAEQSSAGDDVTREGRAVMGGPAFYSAGERRFMLRFGKRDAQSVYFYKDGTNLAWVASIRGIAVGSTVDTTKLHLTSDYRELVPEELFLAQNAAGYVMQGRVKDIRTREVDGLGEDMAIFDYRIVPGQPSLTVAV